MNEEVYMYKGFDIELTNRKDKLRSEYSNPYGYNIYSNAKANTNIEYNITHTNQNNKK